MALFRALGGALFAIWFWIWAVLGGIAIGTVSVLPFAVLPRGRRERYSIVGASAWARFVLGPVLLCRVEITGESGLPPADGALLFCNHRSWLDPLVLLGHTRSNGLSKLEILFIPVIGLFGWLSGAVFFDRRSKRARHDARDQVLRLVHGGARVQVFPEGTRTRDGELREKVYLTLAIDCWQEKVPVIPCAVWGTERVLPVGSFAAFPGQTVRLDVGRALRPEDFPNGKAFAQACWQAVVDRVRQFEREEPVSRPVDASRAIAEPPRAG